MEKENAKNRTEHYDVGIFGVWSGCNYGSIATYYALNRIITSMGKTVLMIDKPILMDNDVEVNENHSRRFGREHYNISRRYRLNEMYQLNHICDTFLIGSDQVWNYGISKNFGKAFYLDFAGEEKKKIAYAISFGHEIDFAPGDEREVIADYMRYFDGIGTREEDGVKICRDCYGIRAEQVIDPVFLADPEIYDDLAGKSSHREEEPFIAAYILDPSPEKTEAILHLQKQFGGIKAVNLLDGLLWLFEKNKKLTNLPNCIENLQVEDWLYYLKNAQFVLTDSCHGASFALIFKRNFIAITNKGRGVSRFNSLSRLFRFENHVTSDPMDVITNPELLKPIDYELTADIMDSQRRRCGQWLYDAVNLPKKSEGELIGKNQIGKVNPINKRAMKKPASCADTENTIIKTVKAGNCSGCGACEAICPKGAIKLQNNQEGFLVPVINRNKCINCGLCLKKCTFHHPDYKNNADPKCFAMMADDETRAVSSSGGMFSVAAEYILERGGVVCGAAYREDYSVEHIIIDDKRELGRLRGSKYMQSYASGIFPDIRKFLQEGRMVLFTGMPCQVAGLYSYLGKGYDTLYTIDLLCHGITSYKVFEKYHRDVLGGKELSRLEFKEKKPWGWHAGINAYFADGTKYSKPLETDPYFIAYLKSIAKNTACGECVSNKLPRQGDLTIGDFWEIAKYDEELYDKRGTSVVLVNNRKAETFFDSLKPAMKRVKEESLDAAVKGNRIIQAPYRLHKNRRQFFRHFDELDFTSLTLGCFHNKLYKYRKKQLLKSLPEKLHEYYYLAQTVAEKARGRKIVLWMRSREFEKVLKDCFGLEAAFSVAKNSSLVNGKTVFPISKIRGRSGEFYIAALDPKDHGNTYKLLSTYGYGEIEDFICRYPNPIVLDEYDCASGAYADAYGNTIEGYSGRLGKVVFRGGNNHIIIGDKVAGTQNLTFDLSANSTIEIRRENKFTAENRFVTKGYNGRTEVLIQKGCRFTDALYRLYNSEHVSSVLIHENCTFESDLELHANSGKKIVIGRDCMFSHDVDLWAGDGHSVFDTATGENVNSMYEKQPPHKNAIVIGEHVWVSKGAFLMHGTNIGTGSIVGAKSVVKGQFPNNCTVGGNPARLLRTNTAWSRDMVTEDIGKCGREEYYALTEGGSLQGIVTEKRDLSGGNALPERSILPEGSVLSGGNALPEGSVLSGGNALPEGSVLSGGNALPEGSVLPRENVRRRVLILGGTGRMSTELTKLCVANGDDVTISVRGRHKVRESIASVKKIILNRNDVAATKSILGGQFFDVVFDCSGYLPQAVDLILSCVRTNRYIYVSSFATYAHYHRGRNLSEEALPVVKGSYESNVKVGERAWYARGKHNSEILIARKYSHVNYAIVRIPFVMSLEDDYEDELASRILKYVAAVVDQEPVCGSKLGRHYNFVENTEEARFLYFLSENSFQGVVNFASQGEITMNEVIRYVEEKTGIKAVIDEKGKELPFSTFPETTMDLGRCLSIPYYPMKLEDWLYPKIDQYIDYCRTKARQNNQTWMISGGGGSTGLGKALAIRLYRLGRRVVATSRDISELDGLPEGILKIQLDVRDIDSCRRAVKAVEEKMGKIDVLVNNAGLSHISAFEETPDEIGEDIMETNYWGVSNMLKAIIPHMRAKGGGAVINISGASGFRPRNYGSYYVASKFAVESLTKNLKFECQRFMRLMAVELGELNTGLNKRQTVIHTRIGEYKQLPPLYPFQKGYSNNLDKAVDAVIRVAAQKELPRGLVLGWDAYQQFPQVMDDFERETEKYKSISITTDEAKKDEIRLEDIILPRNEELRLQNWLITGASGGFGKILALRLRKEGYTVAVTSRDFSKLASLPEDMVKIESRLDSAEECQRVIKTAVDRMGSLDVLVNNATSNCWCSFEECPDDIMRKVFYVNYTLPQYMIKAALPYMRANKNGTVVNITSIAGIQPRARVSTYSAAKAALEGLTRTLKSECRRFARFMAVELVCMKTRIMVHNPVIEPRLPEYRKLGRYTQEIDNIPNRKDIAAQQVINVVNQNEIPQSLLIGTESYLIAKNEIQKARKEFEEYKEITLSVCEKEQPECRKQL